VDKLPVDFFLRLAVHIDLRLAVSHTEEVTVRQLAGSSYLEGPLVGSSCSEDPLAVSSCSEDP